MSSAFYPFDGQRRMGASAVFASSLMSAVALSFVLLCALWIGIVVAVKRTAVEKLTQGGFLFRSQLGSFAVSLLVANLFTSLSGIIEIIWIAQDGIEHGVLGQIGDLATAYFVVALGFHVLITLALRTYHPWWVVMTSVVFGWSASVLIAAGPASIDSRSLGPVYGFVTLSCNITRAYPLAHIFVYFVPLFFLSFASTVIYSVIFLTLRGNITVNGGFKFYMRPKGPNWRSANSSVQQYKRFIHAVARSMLWFPAAFMFCVIPNAIVQLVDTSGYRPSPPATAFTLVLKHMNGVFDVLIFFNVLRVLRHAFRIPAGFQEEAFNAASAALTSGCNPRSRCSLMSDEQPSQKRAPAPMHPASRCNRYQIHEPSRSDGSVANLPASLPSHEMKITSQTSFGHTQSGSCELWCTLKARSNLGHQVLTSSDCEHSRTVTKSMISKPVLVDPGNPCFRTSPHVSSHDLPSHHGRLIPEILEDHAIPVDTLSQYPRSRLCSKGVVRSPILQQALRKPLPLLPEVEGNSLPNHSSMPLPHEALVSVASTSTVLMTPDPSTIAPTFAKHTTSEKGRNDARAYALQQLTQREILVQPLSPTSPQRHPSERGTTVISFYMPSHRSVHEDMLPDFPITASEHPTDLRTPQPVDETPYFVQPVPSIPAVAEALELALSSPVHEVGLATAVVTEFDVNEYMSSPLPPVPTLPASFRPPLYDVETFIASQEIMDTTDYYTAEVPGLPPLPAFRPRLTIYDDEVSAYSASTIGWRFGSRPRVSYGYVRALPLPPHMRLPDVCVSPTVLNVSTPEVLHPTRGFRPIP
ncbi:hypothetical protein K488DRAFT_89323 [Vararia minispora EC-137]|uniref:Uncharacterized protein n=1 Tax=Vararia minispora EC-137 TaxID=1314806 RepID=A0ACB8QAT5_9AGAM|nr:hypothetical protein K488DRAFT_89323 [Vararia minispora EC-137]